MYVLKNSVQPVSKIDGLGSLSAANLPKMSFGYAVKTVFHPKICANFHQMIFNNSLKNDVLFSDFFMIILSVSIVKEIFPAMVSWISKIIFQFVKKKHGIEDQWSKMIEECSTPEFYKEVLIETFADKKYSFGRIYILTVFTENICRKHPQISEEIQTFF
jgi:hypothetical protein